MKDTSQVQNAEDLMVLYEELTFLVSQLNNDAPKIKKMYASLEQTIAQQETVAAKAAQTVEAAASDSVAKMQQTLFCLLLPERYSLLFGKAYDIMQY
jgi:hypothetical protein